MNQLSCIYLKGCVIYNKNVCGIYEVTEKKCGGPIGADVKPPNFYAGTCKLCGKKDIKVCTINDDMTACEICYVDIVLLRRSIMISAD